MVIKFYKKYILGRFKFLVVILLVISIFDTFINVIFPYLLRQIINLATVKDFLAFKNNVLIFSGLWLLSLIFTYVYSIYVEKIKVAVKSALRMDAIRSILKKPITVPEKESTGSYLQVLVDDVEKIENLIIEPYFELISTVLLGIGGLYFMLKISPILTVVSILPVPLYIFLTVLYQGKASRLTGLRQEKFQKVVNFMEEIIKNSALIRNFLWIDNILKAFVETYRDYVKSYMNLFRTNVVYGKLVNFLLSISVQLLVIVLGAYLVLKGNLRPGGVVAFILYVNYVKSPMQYILTFKVRIEPAKVSLDRIMGLIGDSVDSEGKISLTRMEGDFVYRVRNLTFFYDEGRKVIEKLSFDIPEGSWTCIVGETGTGKSTLLNILVGLLKPQRGEVYFMGKDTKNLDAEEILRYVTLVEQEPMFLSNFTIWENLLTDKKWEDVVETGKRIGIGEFIENLDPDLLIGHEASNLSGGEKKRLSILRGVLRDTPVIIFDEPTAYLDERTAKSVLSGLKNYLKDKTVIIVTHDRLVLEFCDNLVEIKQNLLSAKGN